jgi:hypothetical protein
VTRSIFRLLPPPGCPTGTVIAPGDMRGYRRAGESGLSDTQVFFVTGLVACCAQEMTRVPAMQSVRRSIVQPVQIQAVLLRNRQGFTRGDAACESVRIVVPQSFQLDSGGTIVRLRQRIWWPVVRSCERQANRELRCDSGTAPPLYPGDFLDTGKTFPERDDRPAVFRPLPPKRETRAVGEKACSRLSLGVRRPTSIREERVSAARAVARARPVCAGC